jgi:histone acetyltransferase (RNA polymerase elongator complex component)
MAIAQAKDGIFSDVGDANPNNCHKLVSKHILRMASTRAKARVLRDMTNVGITCIDEIGNFDEVIGDDISKKTITKRATRKRNTPSNGSEVSSEKGPEKQPKTSPKETAPKSPPKQDNVQQISEAQRRALLNLARRRNISQGELDKMVQEAFHSTFDNLTQKDASQFIRQLQSAA